MYVIGLDPDMSPDELEEKARLITQVLELQNTLDGKFVFVLYVHCTVCSLSMETDKQLILQLNEKC